MASATVTAEQGQAISRARRVEAAYFEPTRGFADSQGLRLAALKADIANLLAAKPSLSRTAELSLVPGEPPQLWIDLVTSVVMEPNYRTYRIQQEFENRRVLLLETTKHAEALRFVKIYLEEKLALPQRNVARRQVESIEGGNAQGYSLGVLVYAWLTGLVLGLLIILVAINILK